MRVLVMGYATKDTETGVKPSEQAFAEMGKFNEELVKSGILLAAEGLHPSSKGVRVRTSGGKRTVLDGPFTETKEWVAGFSIWKVKSMEEAIEWVRRSPVLTTEDSVVELRPIMEWEDFGLEVAPERKERKEKLRAQFEQQPGS